MAPLTGTLPRDTVGKPIGYTDRAGSPSLAGKWFAYRANCIGWVYAGLFSDEPAARRAAGLEPRA
jgi:hypothetical protein